MYKSFEGRVGRRFPESGVFVTSPNSDVIASPLLGTRTVRMLKELHYGHDDPMFHPQPFDKRLPHLAFIPHPSAFPEPQRLFWFLPEPDHFTPLHPDDPSNGLGHINIQFRQILHGEFLSIRRKVKHIAASQSGSVTIKSDYKIADYISRLKYLFGCLDLPATYDEALVQWRLTQRTCLELTARVFWVQDARLRYYSTPLASYRAHNVIGALTDQLDVAEGLWKSGSPVWLVRQLGTETNVRVDSWLEETPATATSLPTRSFDISISYAEASPSHPVVYTGLAGKVERYAAMAMYAQKLAFPSRIYAMDVVLGDSTASSMSGSASNPPSSSQLSQPSSSSLSSRSTTPLRSATTPRPAPYHKPKVSKTPHIERNKFLDVESPLMPLPLSIWMEVSEEVGRDFNASAHAPPGILRGYALPDPNILAHHSNDSSRIAYFMTYLKLRPVLLYRLRSPRFEPLVNPAWRKLLGLELHGSRNNTKSATMRNELKSSLTRCMESGNMKGTINLDNLSRTPVEWRGTSLSPSAVPPVDICREILWELFEMNFRHELLLLDHYLYRYKPVGFDIPQPDDELEDGQVSYGPLDACYVEDREIKVLGSFTHFNGRRIPESINDSRKGFASRDLTERQEALWSLYQVMEGWSKKMSHGTERAGLTLAPPNILSEKDLKDVEFRLAYHYSSCFVQVIGRAPLLPHTL